MFKEKIVAQKYASAFLNIFSDRLKISDIEDCQKTVEFLRANKDFFALLQAPFITPKKRTEILKKIFDQYKNTDIFLKLTAMLIDKNRLFLLADVLQAVVTMFYNNQGYMHCSLYFAPMLTQDDETVITQFLAKKSGKKIIVTSSKDMTLIAGVRVQSSTLLWEHSIKQQLQAIRRQFIRQELTNGN